MRVLEDGSVCAMADMAPPHIAKKRKQVARTVKVDNGWDMYD